MKPTLNRFFAVFATVVAWWCISGVATAAEQGVFTPSAAKDIPQISYLNKENIPALLEAHKGKVVVLHFWAKWCPPCVTELPEMQRAMDALQAGDELVVLPLSLDRNVADVQAFYKEHNITMPVLLDNKGMAMRALEIRGLPSTVLINREGKEIARRSGVVDWQNPAVRKVIEEALK